MDGLRGETNLQNTKLGNNEMKLKKSIGNQQIYPVQAGTKAGQFRGWAGMTYRQWLIGQIAGGLSNTLAMGVSQDNSPPDAAEIMANFVNVFADAIIASLDEEAK